MSSKSKIVTIALIGCFMLAVFFSCTKDSAPLSLPAPTAATLELPATPYTYTTPQSNIPGDANQIATLGRVLFYDTHLSINNSISCGSCHKQTLAFSDNVPFSNGFQNNLTARNTLPIQNLSQSVFNSQIPIIDQDPPTLFWDGRQKFLISMVVQPVINHIEMGMDDLNAVVARVKALPYYQNLFMNAYDGSPEIDINKISNALSVFTGSILSNNTLFDQVNEGSAKFTALQEQGMDLFFNKYNCNSCHQTQELNGYQNGGGSPESIGFINIGLDVNYADNGRADVTNSPADNGKFKIPNLRNIALTAPYMHDGRYATLNDVLDHYSHGIQNNANLDPRLIASDGSPLQMNISDQEKTAIIAFLNTLTDYSMITDPKYSNPFRTN